MILHTLNAAPTSAAFEQCMALLEASDALLLLGDGVYAAITHSAARARIDATKVTLYALDTDMQAAGIAKQCDKINVIDMDGFVALSERFSRQQAWY